MSVGRAIENDIRRGGDCDGIDWGSSWSEAGPELVEDRLFRDADYVRGGARVGGRDDLCATEDLVRLLRWPGRDACPRTWTLKAHRTGAQSRRLYGARAGT